MFGVVVGPVMGSGGVGGWVGTRLVRRVGSVGGGWVRVGYGGARVGVGSAVRGCDVSGGGMACSERWAPGLLGFLAWRARRVCLRLCTTAARSAASVCAAVPNTRQDAGLKLPSF